EVDRAPVDFADSWTYKGLMYSGVPNLISTFGYINASWTLRADLIADHERGSRDQDPKLVAIRVVGNSRFE
ncbi:MAG: hypothetical protein JRE43_11810, partial [Deltaproteobacteria bacterium]|nr:hypothetical protein [Deltaproteobacteria bacterium]